MADPPDDCAIEVIYIPGKELQFTRIQSKGLFSPKIVLDSDGSVKIPYGETKAHRFAISFSLSDEGASGGFAGIKIWWEKEEEPKGGLFLPPRGDTETIWSLKGIASFDLHTFFTASYDPEKATLLSIGNKFSGAEEMVTFDYRIGVHESKDRRGTIKTHDPRIYNNWKPGSGTGDE